jgi:DNA polymerase III epsilon subunit-like protein
MKQSKEIIIYDTEYWTDEGVMVRHWGGINDMPPLLYQIGAYKISVEDGLPIISDFSKLIKAKDEKGTLVKTTPYFENLTKITQEMIDNKGVALETALNEFSSFSNGCDLYSFGNDMYHTVLQSCFIASINCPFHVKNVKDIRKVLILSGMSEAEISKNSSGSLASFFGINIDNHQQHNARSDAFSIIEALRFLLKNNRLDLSWL